MIRWMLLSFPLFTSLLLWFCWNSITILFFQTRSRRKRQEKLTANLKMKIKIELVKRNIGWRLLYVCELSYLKQLIRSTLSFSVHIRCYAHDLLELMHEMFIIIVTATCCYSWNVHFCCDKEILCKKNPSGNHVLMKTCSENILVSYAKPTVAKAEITANFLSIPIFLGINVNFVS